MGQLHAAARFFSNSLQPHPPLAMAGGTSMAPMNDPVRSLSIHMNGLPQETASPNEQSAFIRSLRPVTNQLSGLVYSTGVRKISVSDIQESMNLGGEAFLLGGEVRVYRHNRLDDTLSIIYRGGGALYPLDDSRHRFPVTPRGDMRRMLKKLNEVSVGSPRDHLSTLEWTPEIDIGIAKRGHSAAGVATIIPLILEPGASPEGFIEFISPKHADVIAHAKEYDDAVALQGLAYVLAAALSQLPCHEVPTHNLKEIIDLSGGEITPLSPKPYFLGKIESPLHKAKDFAPFLIRLMEEFFEKRIGYPGEFITNYYFGADRLIFIFDQEGQFHGFAAADFLGLGDSGLRNLHYKAAFTSQKANRHFIVEDILADLAEEALGKSRGRPVFTTFRTRSSALLEYATLFLNMLSPLPHWKRHSEYEAYSPHFRAVLERQYPGQWANRMNPQGAFNPDNGIYTGAFPENWDLGQFSIKSSLSGTDVGAFLAFLEPFLAQHRSNAVVPFGELTREGLDLLKKKIAEFNQRPQRRPSGSLG